MNMQRAFIALACVALLAACGGKDDDNGGDTASVPVAPAASAPITPPASAASDTTMVGHAMGADTMMHDSMGGMAHDTMQHDTAKK